MKYKTKSKEKKPVQIGLNVKAARKDQGITQEELGLRIGKDRQEVSRIESGSNSKVDVYYEISDALQMALEDLVSYHKKHKKKKGENEPPGASKEKDQ